MTLPQGKHQYQVEWRNEGHLFREPELIKADRFETNPGWVEFWTTVGGRNIPIMKINSGLVRSIKMVENTP